MIGGCRSGAPTASKTVVEEKLPRKDIAGEGSVVVMDESSLESEIAHLRGCWELASVLNFLNVFEPVIGGDLKLTAEDIETALVKPNGSLARLHVLLLKGIPPVNKALNDSEAWITALCKKLAIWWPWVAEGQLPLSVSKGYHDLPIIINNKKMVFFSELDLTRNAIASCCYGCYRKEISRYKELDPTNRLLLLKALCDVRADQHDAVAYVNDALKRGTQISCFRKDKIGEDGNATSYWCDGHTVIGHRLYKEVNKINSKKKLKAKSSNILPAISLQWETVATNFEEFRKVVDELSSSKVGAEVAIGRTIESNVLPDVEKFQKKKDRALKQKQRQEKLLSDSRSYVVAVTRSCRNRRPISYTFVEYDRAINEAIELTKKRKTLEQQRHARKHFKVETSNGSDVATVPEESFCGKGNSSMGTHLKDEDIKENDSVDSETESDRVQDSGSEDDDDYDNKSDDDYDDDGGSEMGNSGEEKGNLVDRNHAQKPFGSRWSIRLAGGHPVVEAQNLGTKNT